MTALLLKDSVTILTMKEIFYEPGKLNSNCSYCCKAKPIGFEDRNENLYALGNLCKTSLLLHFVPNWKVFNSAHGTKREIDTSIPQLCAAHITEVQSDHHLS